MTTPVITEQIQTPLLDFDNLDLQEASAKISGLSRRPGLSYVVTPNVDHLSRLFDAYGKEVLRPIYQDAELCLCDSRILEKLLKLTGYQLKSVVTGSDLTKHLFDQVLAPGDSILVLGGEEEKIDILRGLYSSLAIDHINPSMGFINKPEEVDSLIDKVKAGHYHYVFLAVGSPRQEIFAKKLQQSDIHGGVALCIGASINFLVGVEKRAPKLMQLLHIEWLYRMLQDPKRLVKRYATNAFYLMKIYVGLKR